MTPILGIKKQQREREREREREARKKGELVVAEGGRLPPALVLALSPLGLRCFVSSLSFSQ